MSAENGNQGVPRWLLNAASVLLLGLLGFLGADLYRSVAALRTEVAVHGARLENMQGETEHLKETLRRLEIRLEDARDKGDKR